LPEGITVISALVVVAGLTVIKRSFSSYFARNAESHICSFSLGFHCHEAASDPEDFP